MRKLQGIENLRKQSSNKDSGQKPVFCLYVSGATPKSTRAIAVLKPVLDGLYKDGYDLRVIDIYQEAPPPSDVQITAVPMLMREYPLPLLRIGSDFSSAENIRRMLRAGKPQENLGE